MMLNELLGVCRLQSHGDGYRSVMKDLEKLSSVGNFMCKHWYGVTKDTQKSIQPRQSVVRLAFELGTASSSRIERYVFMKLLGHLRVVPFNLRRM